MDRDRLQSGLQIASNIGLLVGLILVGIQIKQASDLTRHTLLVASFQQETDHFDALMGENAAATLARAKTVPEALSPVDFEVLTAYAHWHFSMMRRQEALEQLGFVGSRWRTLVPWVGVSLASNPVTREVLLKYDGDPGVQAMGHTWLTQMQDEARKTPPDSSKRFIEHMLRAASASGEPAGAESSVQGQEQ